MRRLLCVLVVVLGARCTTFMEVVQDNDEGTARRYPVTAGQAWEMAKTIFRWEGAEKVEEHRAEGYPLAGDTEDRRDFGTVMAAWVETDPDGVVRVTVRTRSRVALNPAKLLTEEIFHNRFAQAVDIGKAAKPLPPQLPD